MAWDEGRVRAFALVALVAATSCGVVDTIKARRLAREGNAAYRASDYRGAVAKYHEAIELDPHTPNVYLNLGYALFSIYDPSSADEKDRKAASQAIDAFDRHLEQTPKDDKAVAFRIKTLLRAAPNDPVMADKAYEQFVKLLKENPADAEARQFLITLFIDCRRYAQAETYFKAPLEQHPDDVETMKILAIIADKSGAVQDAVDWYRRRAEAAAKPEAKASFYYELGTYAWNTLHYQPDKAQGVAAVRLADQGIEGARRAMGLKADYAEAMAYANLLYLKRAIQEPSAEGKYFDETIAFDFRTQAAKILGARKEKEAAEGTGSAPPAPSPGKPADSSPR